MMDKQFHMLQLVQSGLGFGDAESHQLSAIASFVRLEDVIVTLPDVDEQLSPIIEKWTRNNLLVPHDVIYAQRLWMLALAGVYMKAKLDTMSDAIRFVYKQVAAQLPPAEQEQYADTLQKAEMVDVLMLKQCYDRVEARKS